MEWEDGGNRSLQIAEGPCSVVFDWGDEGSLRVEASNVAGHIENGHVEGAPAQEHSPQVHACSSAMCWLFSTVMLIHFLSIVLTWRDLCFSFWNSPFAVLQPLPVTENAGKNGEHILSHGA